MGVFYEVYYLANNPDVAKAVTAGIFGTGWEHFLTFGSSEDRSYNEPDGYGDFNEEYYLAQNPDVAKAVEAGAFGTGWDHFQQFGEAEGRSFDAPDTYGDFNEEYYLADNPDVAKAVTAGQFGTGWDHYVQFGAAEGRSDDMPAGYDDFNEVFYLARNADVAKAVSEGIFATGWDHFLQYGEAEGRVYTRPISAVTHGGALPGEVPPDTDTFTIYRDHYVIPGEHIIGTPPVTAERVMWGYNPPEDHYYDNDSGPSDGGIPLEDLVSFLTTITGLDLTELGLIDNDGVGPFDNVTDISLELEGPSQMQGPHELDGSSQMQDPHLSISFDDGTTMTFLTDESAMSEQYFNFLNNLLFDEYGNTRLYVETVVVEPGTGSYTTNDIYVNSVVLTEDENNGMTVEPGFTSNADDTIVVGRLNLLHGAYIDAGGGWDILEVDAKGSYAQPVELLNIEQVNIENLPNVYTAEKHVYTYTDASGACVTSECLPTYSGWDQNTDPNFQDRIVSYSTYPDRVIDVDRDPGNPNSILDLSRATSLQTLVITEGLDTGYDLGTLTLVGIRNGATARFEGSFTQDVTLHYSEGLEGPLTVELDLGLVTADLNFVHNSDDLTLVSLGDNGESNTFSSHSLGGTLTHLYIEGDAFLGINGNLDDSFEDSLPVTIDASANTGGVSLELTDENGSGAQNVTFLGSSGNDTFIVDTDEWDPQYDTALIDDESVTIVDGGGNNHFEIDSRAVDVTLMDGDNKVVVNGAETLTIVPVDDYMANGDNHIQVGEGGDYNDEVSSEILIQLGNGDNQIEIYSDISDDTGAVDDSLDYPNDVNIAVGEGQNNIDVEVNDYIGTAEITAGDGGNLVDVSAHSATIDTGSGADTVKVLADEIRVHSGGGGDTITVGGWDYDYVGTDDLGGNGDADGTPMWGDDAALIQIDTGSGAATVILGSDEDYQEMSGNDFPGVSSITAVDTLHDISYITGEDITLYVKTVADLREADLSGISRVVLDDDAFVLDDAPVANDAVGGINAAVLTLRASQFNDIIDNGGVFEVEGAAFNTHGFVKLLIDHDTILSDVLNELPSNVDLLLEVQDGATLTLTAEQLHTRVAQNGITLENDGNDDVVGGSVVINGGGADFDPFNTSDTVRSVINGHVYVGGSLSDDFAVDGPDAGDIAGDSPSEWYNVQVNSVYHGYDRPADAEVEVVFTIDSDILPGGVVDAFDTWHTNLEIVGETDITSDGPIELGMLNGVPANPFTVDFSALEANVDGLILDNFELLAQGGGIYGNADNGYSSEIHIHIANDPGQGVDGAADGSADFGWDEDSFQTLVSQGVDRYIVTQIDGPTANGSTGNTATIVLCDTAQDIETFGLRGNYNDTLNIVDAAWDLAFELQAGGTAKAEGPTGTANVGQLVANYEWDGADAQVTLVHSVDGDDRAIHAEGVTINNADTIAINATNGDGPGTMIENLSGDSVEGLDVNAAEGNVTIGIADDGTLNPLPDSIDDINAADVAGTFETAIDPNDDFSFVGSQGGTDLHIVGDVDDPYTQDVTEYFTATDDTSIDGGAGGTTLHIYDNVSLADADLVDGTIDGVILDQDATLELSMADADDIGAANFALADNATAATLNLQGLDGEPFAVDNYADGISIDVLTIADLPEVTLHADTDLSGIGQLNVPEGTVLNLTAEQYQQLTNATDAAPNTNAIVGIDGTTDYTVHITDLTQADVDHDLNGDGDSSDAGEFLDLSQVTADHQTVTMAGDITLDADDDLGEFDVVLDGDGITLTLVDLNQADGLNISGGTNTTLQFTDISAANNLPNGIDASGFDVDQVMLLNVLVANQNVDQLLMGLPEDVEKVIYNGEGWVDGVDQTAILDAGTTVPGFIAFNKPELDVEIQNFTLVMEGGSEISGDLILSTMDQQALIPTHLKTLIIDSNATADDPGTIDITEGANLMTGETANIITGYITPAGGQFSGDYENNLLDITIFAEQDLIIEGGIVFNSVTGDDSITANDIDDAVALLTIDASSTADVSLGRVDTSDDDVDALNVVNNGTGTVSLTLDATLIDQDVAGNNNDALSFTGANIQLTTMGMIDLSDDVLTGVSEITIDGNGDLTLTQAQFNALGAANLLPDTDTATTATFNIVDFDGAVPFDATTIADGIDVVDITLLPGTTTLAPATDLTGVDQIIVPENSTLNLTAAQFQELQAAGTIVGVDVDGDNADGNPFFVNITGLTQADVNYDVDNTFGETDGLDLSGIADAATVTVSLAEDVDLAANTNLDDVSRLEMILADGQTLGLDHIAQMSPVADGVFSAAGTGLTVTGGVDSILEFRFTAGVDGNDTIDASGIHTDILRVLDNFIFDHDVELLQNLSSDVDVYVFEDLTLLDGAMPIFRDVFIEEDVTVPGFMVFNDYQNDREVRTLDVTLLGNAVIDGTIGLQTVAPGGNIDPTNFETLIINSQGDAANEITGSVDPTVLGPGNISGNTPIANNLLDVTINADQDFELGGDFVFQSIDTDGTDETATLTVNGTANVTIQHLDTSDAIGDGIGTMNIDNNLVGGTLTITGASPALFDNDQTENLIITGDGATVFGDNPAVLTESGIDSDTLSLIDASGSNGSLDLGEIINVDSTDFTFISGTGKTTALLSTDALNVAEVDGDGIDAADENGWTLDFSDAGPDSMLTLDDVVWTEGPLDIDLGANTTLMITEDTDWRPIDLTLAQTLPIILGEGVELKVTAQQAHGLNIIPEADIVLDPNDPAYVAADVPVVNIFDLGEAAYDFSDIQTEIAGTMHLEDDDVTVNELADLGDFSVTLEANDPDNLDLSGQTIRFNTEAQAAREIIIIDDDGTTWDVPGDDVDNTNSSNVVWLFDSVADSIDTSEYDANLGRLWITPDLANGANAEELFNTLPDSILRVEFSSIDELDILLLSSEVDRTVELVSFTDLPAGMIFSDEDRLEHVSTLTVEMGGQVNLGSLTIGNIVNPPAGVAIDAIEFTGLTINSHRALSDGHYLATEDFVNDNDGIDEAGEHVQPNPINVVGDIMIGNDSDPDGGLDLLTVNLNTLGISTVGNNSDGNGTNLEVGTITFDSEDAASTATLNVSGSNSTTVASTNTDDPEITTLVVHNVGPGSLTITGASPAAAVSNTETLVITATGPVTLGTAGDLDKPGVSGADLSDIDVNGTADVDLGVIALVDSLDFELNTEGSTGDVTATLGADTAGAPVLAAGGEWIFDGSDAENLALTITDAVTFGAGQLTLDDVAVTIFGNVDFTTLTHDDPLTPADEEGLVLIDTTIDVPAGATLTILAEDADGLTVTGDGTVTITELELTPDADLSGIMTTDGDTGLVEALVTTDVAADVDFIGDLGKAHVTVSGDGVFDVTGATLDSAAFDHDDDAGTPDAVVMTTFTVEAGNTLELAPAQLDDRVADGAGSTEFILTGAPDDVDLSGLLTTGGVDGLVNANEDFDKDADFGITVITVNDLVTLTVIGETVDGVTVAGEGTVLIDSDDLDGDTIEDPINADFSHFTIENITFDTAALVDTIVFPVLYGDTTALPAVPVQTVTMTSVQADGQTITSTGPDDGAVIVNVDESVDADTDGDVDAFDLSGMAAGVLNAIFDQDAAMDPLADFGSFDLILGDTVDLELSAAQADSLNIIEDVPASVTSVNVTNLEDTLGADLSHVVIDTETAELDANANPTLTANLGNSGFTVTVSDSDVLAGPNVVTFDGILNTNLDPDTIDGTQGGLGTTFLLADQVTFVLDAADAHQLIVTDTSIGNDADVIVNDLVGPDAVTPILVDFSGFTLFAADMLNANVPLDTLLNVNSDLGDFDIHLAEDVDLALTAVQMLAVSEGDFWGTPGGVLETLTVNDYYDDPATAGVDETLINSAALNPNVVIRALNVRDTDANVAVNPAADFSKVQEIIIPDGTTLTMTADQFMQMPTGVVSGAGTLNLTQLDSDNALIDLSTVTAHAGTITLDPAKGIVVLPLDPTDHAIVLDAAAVVDNAAGDMFSFVYSANDQALTFSSETQADGRVVDGTSLTHNYLILGFTNADASDADAVIECAHYDEVEHVWVLNDYLYNEFGISAVPANFEFFLNDLPGSPETDVTVYDVDTLLNANLLSPSGIDTTDRVVIIDKDTAVDASVAFNDLNPGTEVSSLDLTFEGNAVVTGDLILAQNEDPQSGLPATLPGFFKTLTIHSVDTPAVPGTGPNELMGDILADSGADGPASESRAEVFTLTLDPAISIDGTEDSIGFDGGVVTLADGDNTDAVGAALAGGVYTNWDAAYNAATDTVTFTNLNAGDVTDVALGDFTWDADGFATVGLPGAAVVATSQQGIFVANENNLYDVDIEMDHDLIISGELEMSYVTRSDMGSDPTVMSTIDVDFNADADVETLNIGSVNTDDEHISGVTLTVTGGAGVVNAPGTSPGFSVDNTEELHINTSDVGQVITLGTAGDPDKPGVAGEDLSHIDINGPGQVNLGVVSSIDGHDFTLNADGATPGSSLSMQLGADSSGGPVLLAGGSWTFNGNHPGNLMDMVVWGSDVVFGAGDLTFDDVYLSLELAVDFSALTSLTFTSTTIAPLAAGTTLTLTCAQADGLTLSGAGTLVLVGDELDAQDFSHLAVEHIDLSGIASAENNDVDLDLSGHAGVTFNIIGSDFNDDIRTADGDDTIHGGLGDDSLRGDGGNDHLYGDDGNDTLRGQAGDDDLHGGLNDDILIGGGGDDTFHVDAGHDTISDLYSDFGGMGVTEVDSLVVSSGAEATANDINMFAASPDTSNEGIAHLNGDNSGMGTFMDLTLSGGTHGYDITGTTIVGGDLLIGSNFDDTFHNFEGADIVLGGLGDDTLMLPGSSPDLDAALDGELQDVANIDFSSAAAGVFMNLIAQSDGFNIQLSDYNDVVQGSHGDDIILGGLGDDVILGDGGSDLIDGGDGNDDLRGNAGDDMILGDLGDDFIRGNEGADTLTGGDGNDIFSYFQNNQLPGDSISDFDAGGTATDDHIYFIANTSFGSIFSSANFGTGVAFINQWGSAVPVSYGISIGTLMDGPRSNPTAFLHAITGLTGAAPTGLACIAMAVSSGGANLFIAAGTNTNPTGAGIDTAHMIATLGIQTAHLDAPADIILV